MDEARATEGGMFGHAVVEPAPGAFGRTVVLEPVVEVEICDNCFGTIRGMLPTDGGEANGDCAAGVLAGESVIRGDIVPDGACEDGP